MNDGDLDIARLLRTAERPRVLSDAERHRLVRLFGTTFEPTLGDETDAAIELSPPAPTDRSRRRFATTVMLAGCSLAAAASLLVVFTMRSPTADEPVRPISEPTATLPSPSEFDDTFCTDDLGPVTDALVRWRSVENWAWAQGEPDIGRLVDAALETATDFDDRIVAAEAQEALERLRAALTVVGTSRNDRDSVALTVEAVDEAIDALGSVARRRSPPCDVDRLTVVRRQD